MNLANQALHDSIPSATPVEYTTFFRIDPDKRELVDKIREFCVSTHRYIAKFPAQASNAGAATAAAYRTFTERGALLLIENHATVQTSAIDMPEISRLLGIQTDGIPNPTLPRELVTAPTFGSMTVRVPPACKRAGDIGEVLVWLNPGEETWGMHAEGAALSRRDDAERVLAAWTKVVTTIDDIRMAKATGDAARDALREFATLLGTIGSPGTGIEKLLAQARAVIAFSTAH